MCRLTKQFASWLGFFSVAFQSTGISVNSSSAVPVRSHSAKVKLLMRSDVPPEIDQPSSVQQQMPQELAGVKKLKVAIAVFITDIGTPGWRDALYVLAHSLNKAAARSHHEMTLVALLPDDFPYNRDGIPLDGGFKFPRDEEAILFDAGFKEVYRRAIPVLPSQIKGEQARHHMLYIQGNETLHTSFELTLETLKYWGLAMTSYDRVLVADADVVIFDPMDELFERDEDFVGTYDHGLDIKGTTLPPVQGGFLLFRPNMQDFKAIQQLTQEGDWRGGSGWKLSGVGYCYGGVGPVGLLSYYFNKDALEEAKRTTKELIPEGLNKPALTGSRMLAVDRGVYDVVVNDMLLEELEASSVNHDTAVSNVKSVHFTGNCAKPWMCAEAENWLCQGLVDRWWDARAELQAERGLPPSYSVCIDGQYEPLRLTPDATQSVLLVQSEAF